MRDVTFTPADWYWLADDGRLFSSASASLVQESSGAYQAWLALDRIPTAWPHDDAGQQTDSALKAVLNPYGIWIDESGAASSPVITHKGDVIRRLTDDEAEAMETAINTAPAKLRLLWNGIATIDHSDAEFGTLRSAIVDALKATGLSTSTAARRADELLGPSI